MQTRHDNDQHLDKLIDLIWAHAHVQNDYLKANETVIDLIRASKFALCERAELYRATALRQIHDPLFPTYNANQVPNSHFAVAEGPHNSGLKHAIAPDCIARFFENTLFNNAFPIKTILAIGQPGEKQQRGDFAPYFFEGTYTFKTHETTGEYNVVSTCTDSILNCYTLSVISPQGLQRTACLVWLPVADLHPLPTHPTALASLTQVYNAALTENVLIHCAAGVGRTGCALLAFKLLEHYESIFSHSTLTEIAANIQAELLALRKIRPVFITTQEQLKSAIKCAMYIYSNEKT